MSDKTELLPCPFCGGAASVGPTKTSYIVECNNASCAVNPDAFAVFKHNAIAAWNRRATIQPTVAEPVGLVVADDPVHGWHMIALKPWNEIGANVKLYTGPVAALADAVRDARNEALEEAAQLCDELDNPENSEDYRAGAAWCCERIRALKSNPTEGQP